MKPPRAPPLDERRAEQLEAELFERARAWFPSWSVDDEHDFGRALLKIAARFGSEVTEGLDRGGERMRLAFLDWLAVPAEAARPARMPVVFKLSDSAREPVLAARGTRLQVEAAGLPVILETEKDVLLLPSHLRALVGVDADSDAFYLPPPDLSSLARLEALPVQWQLESFTSAGATKLQLDPELGLAVDMLIELGGRQYRLAQVDKDIVTIEPPLAADQSEQTIVTKVAAFTPFDSSAQNRQEHALYLGGKELFDIEAAAMIEIAGAKVLTDLSWQYWGKVHPDDEVTWQTLTLANEATQAKSDAIVLEKGKGSVELLELVKDKNSRWIRAIAPTVQGAESRLQVDRLEVRINCQRGTTPLPAGGAAPDGPSAEGMANTTPLMLDDVFFPFGKEPRQFDAFYLGSKEAFSKKGADVMLDLEMADTTFCALSAVSAGPFDSPVLAGVAQDGALHLLQVDASTGVISKFREREPLRPPPSGANTGATLGVQLDRRPRGRAPVWQDAQGFLVAAAAADAVWVWRETLTNQNDSQWVPFGSVPSSAADPTATIDDLVYLADTSMLFALRGGQLSVRRWPDGPQWTPLETKDGPQAVVLKAIVPVLTGDSLATLAAAGMVGVAEDKNLYEVKSTGTCSKLSSTDVSAEVRPVAVQRGAALIVALAHSSSTDLSLFHSVHGEKTIPAEPEAAARGFDAVVKSGKLNYLASVQLPSGGYLASWTPHAAPGDDINLLRAPIPAGLGQPDGAPTAIGGHVVVPGRGGDLLVADLDLTQRLDLEADVGEGVFTADSALQFAPGDLVARESSGTPPFKERLIAQTGVTSEKQAFYLLDASFDNMASGPLHGFHLTGASRFGNLSTAGTLQLEADDEATLVNGLVRAGTTVYRVTGISGSKLATLSPLPTADATPSQYWSSAPITGRVAPFIRPIDNNWDAALLDLAVLLFKGASPPQRGKAFSIGAGNRPLLIELSAPWTALPAAVAAPFVLDAAVGSWTRSLGDTSTNPELSWEYWNGAGWWKLVVTRDDTLRLKKSGQLQFTVPADLSPTDWSGRTNYWIRARLIGGDYGRESVSVATSPRDKDGFTHQTVERSTKDIHAPSVVRLTVSYGICENVLPTFVLTKDSGSLRDQSDANRTAGAQVEAFVPVAVMLGRLSGASNAQVTGEDSPADCHCPEPGSPTGAAAADSAPTPTASVQIAVTSAPPATGRAIYLGFDVRLSGEPVNVLLLIEERDHDKFAPLTVEALIADRFVPIVVNDTTRALGESGVLSLAFAIAPTPRELFGKTLTWLRLAPKAGTATTGWRPTILGAYLNAVWAAATETLTYEPVGSSQGEPNLTLFLAKPPVLRDTLELRVREPLGDDERDALAAQGADHVLSAVANLPGDWVLWRRVIDPLDESPTQRVYALDDATGEIRFGDGRHGRIPPVGRDSIVAFRYQRTETGAPDSAVVPANTIAARTALNLASPVAGVEAVFAADQAAGGAAAESTERVLRFGVARLRHRERALTAHDVEDLALASSPEIAQARCFMRNGMVRLVVVMRGVNPIPSAAQVRELRRLLLAEAPPSLSARQALRIGGPAIHRLRVNIRLRVATLDDAGAVARDARNQMIALFDTLTGGPDEAGWQLGENPTEGDIAMALAAVPRLESIARVELREIAADGSDQPWPETVKPTELAMLHKDVIRVEFETIEVFA